MISLLNATPFETPESPLPLRKSAEQSTPFPVESLPWMLKNATLALQRITQAPLALCAQSVLASVNMAVQAHGDVRLHGQTKPLSCYFLTIAESGERKTTCDEKVLKPIREHEEQARQNYRTQMISWENEKDTWQRERENVLKDRKTSSDTKMALLDALGAMPAKPPIYLTTCEEPTFEGLCKLMLESQPRLGIFSSEGGQFMQGHGMNIDNKTKTAGGLSKFWDGSPITRVRSIDGATSIVGRRLAMHLLAQPKLCTQFLSDSVLQDQGLLSRFLIAFPESTIGTRFHKSSCAEDHLMLDTFLSRMQLLLQKPLPIKDGCPFELKPKALPLSSQAESCFCTFCDEVEADMTQGQPYEHVRGFASKLPEHAVRLAGTLVLFENPDAQEIDARSLCCGFDLARFYAQEARRLFGGNMASPDILLAEKLLQWLHGSWGQEHISLPDIYQRSLNAIGDKATAARIVRILADHRYLLKNQEPQVIHGNKRRETWRVVKL